MTIDERIEKLAANQERFDRNQEQFEANFARLEQSQAKTETILAGILDTLKRLERIAVAHEVRLDDIDAALSRLEARRPQ